MFCDFLLAARGTHVPRYHPPTTNPHFLLDCGKPKILLVVVGPPRCWTPKVLDPFHHMVVPRHLRRVSLDKSMCMACDYRVQGKFQKAAHVQSQEQTPRNSSFRDEWLCVNKLAFNRSLDERLLGQPPAKWWNDDDYESANFARVWGFNTENPLKIDPDAVPQRPPPKHPRAAAIHTPPSPTHDRPTHDRPTHDRPTHDRPTHDRPTHDRPTHDRPTHDRPTHDSRPIQHDDLTYDFKKQRESETPGNVPRKTASRTKVYKYKYAQFKTFSDADTTPASDVKARTTPEGGPKCNYLKCANPNHTSGRWKTITHKTCNGTAYGQRNWSRYVTHTFCNACVTAFRQTGTFVRATPAEILWFKKKYTSSKRKNQKQPVLFTIPKRFVPSNILEDIAARV
jgi:hypothetical protein